MHSNTTSCYVVESISMSIIITSPPQSPSSSTTFQSLQASEALGVRGFARPRLSSNSAQLVAKNILTKMDYK